MPKKQDAAKGSAASANAKNKASSISPSLGILIALMCLIVLACIYFASFALVPKILLALADLVISGEILGRLKASQRLTYGVYMLRSKVGLRLMDRLANKGTWFWNGLADWGLVLGFGLLSYFIFKKDISRKTLAIGIATILFLLIVVLPYAILPFSFINIPQVTSRIQSGAGIGPAQAVDYLAYVLYASSIIGGFVLYIIVSLAYNSALILYAIFVAIVSSLTSAPNYTLLSNSVPGVAPIIPGITIPLLAGVLSLAAILSIHEFSHGVLARIAKIRVSSSGVLLFGIVPIGAFVEPDEKSIKRISVKLQNRVSSAGVSANMLLSIIMFIPTVLMFFYVLPHYSQSYVYVQGTVLNSSAYNVIAPGSVILKWNGYNVSTLGDFEQAAKDDFPHSVVSVQTANGTYDLRANSTGKVGVYVYQGVKQTGGLSGSIAYFLYSFFGLTFLLSFLVAVVNYLPIPGFDGWRIFNASVEKRLVSALIIFIVATLLINVLPWFWLL